MKPVNTQTIFISGATDGIGKHTAIQLAKQDAHLLIHGRNQDKLNKVMDEIKAHAQAYDQQERKRLWDLSMQLTGLAKA